MANVVESVAGSNFWSQLAVDASLKLYQEGAGENIARLSGRLRCFKAQQAHNERQQAPFKWHIIQSLCVI